MSSKNIEQVDSSIGGGTGVIHCSCPPLAGVQGGGCSLLIAFLPRWRGQGVVTLSLSKGCPAERLETVPYSRY